MKKTKTSTSKSSEFAGREEKAVEQLKAFVVEHGGKPSMVAGFRSKATKSRNKFDVTFYNSEGRRFRSMIQVARHLNLVAESPTAKRKRKPSSREQEAEKKRIRRELERLRKMHQRATKSLDDLASSNNETVYPMKDRLLMEDKVIGDDRTKSAGARLPDMTGFPGISDDCTPDVLMAWDFLCTFEKTLSLAPIALDDFASALVYVPPQGQMGDDVQAPPVYLAEAHLALLKLLFNDRSSDDWWWAILETDETEGIKMAQALESQGGDVERPVIKFNFSAAMAEEEDPLITASWLNPLEKASGPGIDKVGLKNAIRTALAVCSNKWIAAYLRKALDLCKVSGKAVGQKAVIWLVKNVKEARPELGEQRVNPRTAEQAKAKVVSEVTKQMDGLDGAVPVVKDEDAVSDLEYEEEDSDDESDEELEGSAMNGDGMKEDSERPVSKLPPKPVPSLTDLLLPPQKPYYNSEFVNPFSWSHLVGATSARILHRKKRVLNEVDDSIRESNELAHLTAQEQRERESRVASRILTECVDGREGAVDDAVNLLASGGNYLSLSAEQRLCLLRVLIEAAYDTHVVHQVVSNNYKQRTSAMKALDVEQRRAKREAKQKVTEDEAAARQRLAAQAREKFLDEKREEIRQLNAKSKEFTDDVIDSLTDEDIIDFDDDIKADFEALPTAESFAKATVVAMVARIQEEEAFDTDAVRILSMDELVEKEKGELEELQGQFDGFGGEAALIDGSLDRETIRSLERLRRDIDRARSQSETLPEQRSKVLDQLTEAINDGTIKVLRAAYNAAKKAKLVGDDNETGGIWAVNAVRSVALELEKAKQNKRVLDAQRDLVAKRNKCFIRAYPVGRDRFGNCFWSFKKAPVADDSVRIWAETECVLKDSGASGSEPPAGYINLMRDKESMELDANDMEEDFFPREGSGEELESFRSFSRMEHHFAGMLPSLVKHHWGCHSTEKKLRALIRSLDSKGTKEGELKSHLKESLEDFVGADSKPAAADNSNGDYEEGGPKIRFDGDEAVFIEAKDAVSDDDDIDKGAFETMYTGIGASVRVRQVVDDSKNTPLARYENGLVDAWKLRVDKIKIENDPDAMDVDEDQEDRVEATRDIEVPLWRFLSERGQTLWLTGTELMAGISRLQKWKQGQGYFENDAVFFSYRNNAGRHCGKAADAPFSSSPYHFAKLMIRKEGELYPKLRVKNYDNSWGGQSGQRALWMNSMKDYAYDFQTVQQGLLTLENALFELTDEFKEYSNVDTKEVDAEALLRDPTAVFDLELESMEKDLPGLWNSPTSRAVFIHIVGKATSTGVLALALDLLYRNTTKYLQNHKLLNIKSESELSAMVPRNTRRRNAWQTMSADWF